MIHPGLMIPLMNGADSHEKIRFKQQVDLGCGQSARDLDRSGGSREHFLGNQPCHFSQILGNLWVITHRPFPKGSERNKRREVTL
jgi:hypothetical protein